MSNRASNTDGSGKPKPPILIAVMGLTGSGKSTFINLASGSNLRVGHSVESCTNRVDVAKPFDLDGREIILYDTPGFNDTNLSETEILRIIAGELEQQYRKKQTLHGIIYVHRISDIRVGGLEKSNFGVFRKLCGDKSLQNVVIVTNMWSRLLSKEEGEHKVHDLETLDGFFKPALERGAQLRHHTKETVESAHSILRSIVKNHPVPVDIQKELVDENRSIEETSAGAEIGKKSVEAVWNGRTLMEALEALLPVLTLHGNTERRNQQAYDLLRMRSSEAEERRQREEADTGCKHR